MSHGLCENSDCGQVLDEPGIYFFDFINKRALVLCSTCAAQLAASGVGEPVEPQPKEDDDGGIEQ